MFPIDGSIFGPSLATFPTPAVNCSLLYIPREIRDLVYHHLWANENENDLVTQVGDKSLSISYNHSDTPEIDAETKKSCSPSESLPTWLFTCNK